MRELRFRVWDSTPGYELMTATVSLADIEKGFNVSGKNRTVMQWTGLTDRNGVEIYEGDIAKDYDGTIGRVLFMGGAFNLFDKDDLVLYYPESRDTTSWEVIGNIYEHGHLLKTTNKGER